LTPPIVDGLRDGIPTLCGGGIDEGIERFCAHPEGLPWANFGERHDVAP